ncbi:MAG: hypothetical protein IEMM0008_1207 [bacterium]|nr:MAG: hypothetical protein IEMM0008_1207 [bacterium]
MNRHSLRQVDDGILNGVVLRAIAVSVQYGTLCSLFSVKLQVISKKKLLFPYNMLY